MAIFHSYFDITRGYSSAESSWISLQLAAEDDEDDDEHMLELLMEPRKESRDHRDHHNHGW